MSLPAHLGLRLLAVAILCLAGAVAWTGCAAQASLRREAAISADRIAAQLARQPGLGSAGPVAMAAAPPQPAPAILTLLLRGSAPTSSSASNAPAGSAATGTASMPRPRGFSGGARADASVEPTIRAVVYRERAIGSVTSWPDPTAAAARVWQRVRPRRRGSRSL